MKTVYYSDELNDDFAPKKRSRPKIDKNYIYAPASLWWRLGAFIVYRIIMTPAACLYCLFRFGMKVKKSKKPEKNRGCMVYCNHTMLIGDAFAPSFALFPKKVCVIVAPENLSAKSTSRFLKMSGAIPLPDGLAAIKNFNGTIKQRLNENCAVAVYPEAHVWPFYTKIRPYPSVSFKFAVQNNVPAYASTATYQKRRPFGTKVTLYIDGPFYTDTSLSPKEAEQKLRNEIYAVMCSRAESSTYTPVNYILRKEQ